MKVRHAVRSNSSEGMPEWVAFLLLLEWGAVRSLVPRVPCCFVRQTRDFDPVYAVIFEAPDDWTESESEGGYGFLRGRATTGDEVLEGREEVVDPRAASRHALNLLDNIKALAPS